MLTIAGGILLAIFILCVILPLCLLAAWLVGAVAWFTVKRVVWILGAPVRWIRTLPLTRWIDRHFPAPLRNDNQRWAQDHPRLDKVALWGTGAALLGVVCIVFYLSN